LALLLNKQKKGEHLSVKPNSKPESGKPQKESDETRHHILPIAPLPEHITQNIDAIMALHTRHEQSISRHQRVVETVTAFFGRPVFLFSLIIAIAFWIVPNILPRRLGVRRFDPPPFAWLGFMVSAGSLLMTAGVLVTQNRQEKLAEQRAQLTLQLNLLSEQKIAKLIALIEELRQDLPNVKNRYDPEAEMMKEAADPHAVIEALEDTLSQELENLQKQQISE
jgi:uncharacterized membrane protein